MERSRRLVVNKEAAERALAYLKLLDCDTLLSILPTVNKLVVDMTTLALTRSGERQPIKFGNYALPAEVALRIFSYLDTESILDCRLVCRSFYTISRDPQLKRTLSLGFLNTRRSFSGKKLDSEEVVDFLAGFPLLKELFIPHDMDLSGLTDSEVDALVSAFPLLDCLDAESVHTLSIEHLATLMQRLPIRALSVSILPESISSLTRLKLVDFGHPLPLLRSDTLKYFECDADEMEDGATLNDLLSADGCPNLETVLMQTYGIEVPLVSKTLLSLDVHAVMVADAFKGCPNLTTLVFLLTHESLKTEDLSCASVKHLSYHNWGGMMEVSASLFPKVETYQTKELTMPFHSMAMKELALKSFTLPANSQHPNLKHLSVSLGEGEDLRNFSGNWPTDLESLKISFGVDDDRIDEHFEEFLGSMLAAQTRLTTLRIDAVLHRPLSSASLTYVSVDGYYTLDILRQTLANCPNLEVICLGEGRSPIFWDNVAMWQSLKNIKVLVPYWCRKTMPPSFSEMMVEGRGGYWHRY